MMAVLLHHRVAACSCVWVMPKKRVVLLVGGVDSGKSWLCASFLRLCAAGCGQGGEEASSPAAGPSSSSCSSSSAALQAFEVPNYPLLLVDAPAFRTIWSSIRDASALYPEVCVCAHSQLLACFFECARVLLNAPPLPVLLLLLCIVGALVHSWTPWCAWCLLVRGNSKWRWG